MNKELAGCRILLVDDEEGILITIGTLLRKQGFLVDTALGYATALTLVKQHTSYDLAFIDIRLNDGNGIDLMKEIRRLSPGTQVAVFTGAPELESAVEAVKLGAFDYITKPVRFETIMAVTRHALNAKKLADEKEEYRANLDAILSSVPDSIIMVDAEGHLVHFNERASSTCGYSEHDLGLNAYKLGKGCKGLCRTLLLETLHSGTGRTVRRMECCPKGKSSRIVTITAAPVKEEGGVRKGAVAVIRDETELVEMEKRVGQHASYHGMIGSSPPMQKVYSLIEALQDLPTTVLINGESGTGKELAAKALHSGGIRAKKPFVTVNCAALADTLLESELFGHVRGAFTGAMTDKAGRFQLADGGTLFLDEIGDISPALQMRLLRFLQEGTFERVGSNATSKVDVRVLAATNCNLAEKVGQGRFRQDLYYRLNVVRLVMPPLRERLNDLALLVPFFIEQCNKTLHRNIQGVTDDVMEIFQAYPWPGNVRELQHLIERAVIVCRKGIIARDDLSPEILAAESLILTPPVNERLWTLDEALAMTGGNKSRAAKLLGVSRRTIYRHL